MQKIKLIRQIVGMKQCDLAKILGIGFPHYSHLENSTTTTPRNYLQLKAKALNVLIPLVKTKIDHNKAEIELLENLIKSTTSNNVLRDAVSVNNLKRNW